MFHVQTFERSYLKPSNTFATRMYYLILNIRSFVSIFLSVLPFLLFSTNFLESDSGRSFATKQSKTYKVSKQVLFVFLYMRRKHVWFLLCYDSFNISFVTYIFKYKKNIGKILLFIFIILSSLDPYIPNLKSSKKHWRVTLHFHILVFSEEEEGIQCLEQWNLLDIKI